MILWSPAVYLRRNVYSTFSPAEFIPPEIPPFLIVENVTSTQFSRYRNNVTMGLCVKLV